MGAGKKILHKAACRKHREEMLDRAIDLLLEGKTTPEYVKLRADKLKQIRR